MLDKLFELKKHGTNVRTEFIVGTTTFMTMAYIIFFQPALFSATMGIKGAIIIGMILTAIVGVGLNLLTYYGVCSAWPSIAPTFLKLDWRAMFRWELIPVIVVFLFMDMLDSVGTLVGVSERAGLMEERKLLRGIGR